MTGSSRFDANWDGFMAYRDKSNNPLADTSKLKWHPVITRLETLRCESFPGERWDAIDPEDIAYDLYHSLVGEIRGRGGKAPSTNTLRGRYDACKIFFDFLVLTGRMTKNPMAFVHRPSSKANQQPYLTAEEDALLAALPKSGHELAIYVLGRGAALREGEICDLLDSDVDLESGTITIRDGKTQAAIRKIPIFGTAILLLKNTGGGATASRPPTRRDSLGRGAARFRRATSGNS